MQAKDEILCAWAGPMTALLFGIGWIPLAGWFPPIEPSLGAEAIVDMYRNNTTGIRAGMLIMMFAGALNIPFIALIALYMRRYMEGVSPVLAYTLLGTGIANVQFFIMPAEIFSAVAFRPERAVDITLFGNDFGWITAIMVNSCTVLGWAAFALGIFRDQSPSPAFPRWFGFLTVWMALFSAPGALLTFFKGGIFSWAGLFPFYLGGGLFFLWYFVAFFLLRKIIRERVR